MIRLKQFTLEYSKHFTF